MTTTHTRGESFKTLEELWAWVDAGGSVIRFSAGTSLLIDWRQMEMANRDSPHVAFDIEDGNLYQAEPVL